MLVIPAIDLKDGNCVRLRQGNMSDETVYSDDPAGMALQWQQQGAQLLHVVDLNGAVDGVPGNIRQIESILHAVTIPLQIGGGIRTVETIARYLSMGVARVVLGTAALRDRPMVERACQQFPGKVILGVDAKGGKVAVQGWTTLSETHATDLLRAMEGYPLAAVIYTDISRDGMLEGPNLDSLREALEKAPAPVIASGGITKLEDIRSIKELGPNIAGAIVGKALYDGKLDYAQALRAAA